MAELLISTDFHSHPAAFVASIDGVGVWTRAGCWSARHNTNGYIPAARAQEFGAAAAIRNLIRSGLWRHAKGGYQMVRAVPAAPGCKPIELWRIRQSDQRPHIPAHVRRAVFERDGHACLSCKATEDLTLDHIHPWSLGGPDTVENLRVLCRRCNSSRGARGV